MIKDKASSGLYCQLILFFVFSGRGGEQCDLKGKNRQGGAGRPK